MIETLFALPLLPSYEICDTFTEDLITDMPHDEFVEQFVDYVFETYVGPNATFPAYLWASKPVEKDVRTTNEAETFHKHKCVSLKII